MSDSVARERRCYIDDMITSAEKVIAYSDGFDQARVVASSLSFTRHVYKPQPLRTLVETAPTYSLSRKKLRACWMAC